MANELLAPTDALNPSGLGQAGPQLSESTQPIGLSQAITNAVQAAPTLDPQSAVSVASVGGNIDQNAQAVAHTASQANTIKAAQSVNANHGGTGGTNVVSDALSWFGHNVVHPIESVASHIPGAQEVGKGVADLANELNKPLQVVQHEWRYLHDVEARHGYMAALSEGLAIAGGAVAGGVVAGPDGAILGGEGTAAVLGQVLYQDSWQRTANGATYRDPNTHSVVSFGRDIANLLTGNRNPKKPNGTLSGVIDGIGDMMLDPLGAAGKIAGQARSVEGAKGQLAKVWGGTSMNPDNVDAAYNTYRSFRTAVRQIAATSNDAEGTGWIVSHYPKLAPIADHLAAAQNDEEVLNVFKDVTKTKELLTNQLPSQTFARSVFQDARDIIANPNVRALDTPNHLRWLTPAAWTRRFTKTPGASFDLTTKEFTSKLLDPNSKADAVDLGRLVRYSQDERTAAFTMGQWIQATPADRIVIARNAYMDVVAHIAHFEPITDETTGLTSSYVRRVRGGYEEMSAEDVRSALKERLDELTGGGTPGHDGSYGATLDGSNIRDAYIAGRQTHQSAGILLSQTGKIGLPSFTQVKRMGAELVGARDISGKLDDFAYNAITARFFKPLVLLSLSYAQHIALAEMIPNTLRLGLTALVRASYHKTMAKLGYNAIDEREVPALLGYMARFSKDGIGRDKIADNIWREAATIVAIKTEGHMVTRGLSAGENYSKELQGVERPMAAFRSMLRSQQRMKAGNDFALFRRGDRIPGPSDENNLNYLNHWQDWFREVSHDAPSRRAATEYRLAMAKGKTEEEAMRQAQKGATSELNKLTPAERDYYIRAQNFSTEHPPAGWTPMDDWGQQVAANMRAVVGKGGNAEAQLRLLRNLEADTTPSIHDFQRVVPQEDWPVAVKGRTYTDDPQSTVQRIAQLGFSKIINPFVNKTSREPLFMAEAVKQWKQLKPLVEDGLIDYDEAANLMMDRATLNSIKFVHNLHDRSQLSETMRNWVPFFFAQEQAYRRMGRLLAEDPGAFRRYQMMIVGVAQQNAKMQNSAGQGYFAFPGGTWLAKGTLSIFGNMKIPFTNVEINPIVDSTAGGFSANLSSANVIFPLSSGFRPDVSPIGVMAAKALYGMFPELGPSLSKLTTTQALSSPNWELLVPNTTAQRILRATLPGVGGENDRSFASSMMQAIQLAAYDQQQAVDQWAANGRKGPEPQIVPKDTAPYAEKQAFINRIKNQTRILFLTNAVLGFMSPISPAVSVKDFGFHNELSNDITKAGSVSKGITEFLNKHPEATPYTVWQSTSPSGATLPSNDGGMQWINGHEALINKYPTATFYMMPDFTGPYDAAVYNEQLAQGLRTKRTPTQFLDAIYVGAGNSIYYPALAQHEAIVNAVGVPKTTVNAEYARWTQFIDQLSAAMPTWAAQGPLNKQAKGVIMQQSITEMRQMAVDGDAPAGENSTALMQVLAQFETANNQYTAASQTSNYAHNEKVVKDTWQNYVLNLATSYPQLKSALDAIFLNALGEVTANSGS
jgi:hypothetical protein